MTMIFLFIYYKRKPNEIRDTGLIKQSCNFSIHDKIHSYYYKKNIIAKIFKN